MLNKYSEQEVTSVENGLLPYVSVIKETNTPPDCRGETRGSALFGSYQSLSSAHQPSTSRA